MKFLIMLVVTVVSVGQLSCKYFNKKSEKSDDEFYSEIMNHDPYLNRMLHIDSVQPYFNTERSVGQESTYICLVSDSGIIYSTGRIKIDDSDTLVFFKRENNVEYKVNFQYYMSRFYREGKVIFLKPKVFRRDL